MHYQAFLAEHRYLMARFVRDGYGKLSDHGYTPNAADGDARPRRGDE